MPSRARSSSSGPGTRPFRGWHFLPANRRLRFGDERLARKGSRFRLDSSDTPRMCYNGFHASRRAIDAVCYAPGPFVARVELRGLIIEIRNKAVASERKTLTRYVDASRTLHEFALWVAERILARYNRKNSRLRKAIDLKRRWLDGNASENEMIEFFLVHWYMPHTSNGRIIDAVGSMYAVKAARGIMRWAVPQSWYKSRRAEAMDVLNAELERRLRNLLRREG